MRKKNDFKKKIPKTDKNYTKKYQQVTKKKLSIVAYIECNIKHTQNLRR